MLSGDEGAPMVVRRHVPTLRNALIVGALLVGLITLYLFYELGRYDGGYDRQAAAQQRTVLEVQIEHLERENRQLRTQAAELDTIRAGRAREQAEVARDMGNLQAQVARQSQELAFYRGVVAQGSAVIGVRIEQLHITAGAQPSSFVVHMSLVRSGRADTEASGTVHLTVDGSSGSAAQSLDLPALTAGRVRELRYNFRYLQNIEQQLTMPPGFKPEQLAVEVQSSRHDEAPLSQTFLWTIEAP
jgi:hypothetical protein